MKKYIFIALAAIAMLSSCSKESLVSNDKNGKEAQVFTATMEDGITTKVTFDATNKCALWEVNDEISIDGHTYKATSAGASSTFTGEGATETTHHAYFPANLYNGGTPTLPAELAYAEGKFNMPMYAESSAMDLSFRNLCGVLAITVKGEDFTSVSSIEVSSDKQMNGEFTATADGVLTFANKETLTAADKKVTLTFASPKSIASNGSATFYIPVPANTHNPLTIKVFDGAKPKASVTTKGGGVAVERNTVYPITFNPNKTIADILATVEGGFPNSSTQYSPPINAWTNGGNVFANTYSVALFFSTAYVTLSTSVTKDGDSYTSSASSNTVKIIFNMTDGILTSIEYKRVSGANTNTDGIFYAKPIPVELTMTPEKKDNGYNVTINIKGTDILSCSYCFVDMAKYNYGTYKDSMTDLTDQQLIDVNSSGGYSVSEDNCTYSEGYKIVLAVSTSTVSSKTIVAGYYLKEP